MADQVRKGGRSRGRHNSGKRVAPRAAKASPQKVDPSKPLKSRPAAEQRREPPTPRSSWAQRRGKQMFDAVPDKVDLRDWPYRPRLVPLPDRLVNTDRVPFILDQQNEGACTGFALAAVVNFLLQERGIINARQQDREVSPRMLYELARKYDEWPGEEYEGSSARGAMKAWVAHGVCARKRWTDKDRGVERFTQELAELSKRTPGGAFYRVQHREVRDMHSALHEAGILYVTLMVHDGWFFPGVGVSEEQFRLLDDAGRFPDGTPPERLKRRVEYSTPAGNYSDISLPVIQRIGRADSGHAVALVGYTSEGFIVQNSWGRAWGTDGFALLPYEDYLLHATDVWVAQLGVPVGLDLWAEAQRSGGSSSATSGIARAATSIPLSEIRPYTIDIGNDGRLSDSGEYWTTPADLRDMVTNVIPKHAREKGWSKKRVLLYLHGGLNDEGGVAARVVAFRDVCLANEIYPVHIMWETGLKETLRNILDQFLTGPDSRAGGFRDWVDRFREGLVEAKDRSLELSLARPGRLLWNEMKQNADLASRRADRQGAMQLLAQVVRQAVKDNGNDGWELHLIGHSAGSIFLAHAIDLLLGMGLPVKTLQFFAPAITVALFKEKLMRLVGQNKCPMPSLFVLSDAAERDDEVGPYGKSLLYLVSNAFEERVGADRANGYVPLLGMQRFFADVNPNDPSAGEEAVDVELAQFLKHQVNGRPALVVSSNAATGERGQDTGNVSHSRTHGGFDNDYETLNSALVRILGKGNVTRPFTTRDLQY